MAIYTYLFWWYEWRVLCGTVMREIVHWMWHYYIILMGSFVRVFRFYFWRIYYFSILHDKGNYKSKCCCCCWLCSDIILLYLVMFMTLHHFLPDQNWVYPIVDSKDIFMLEFPLRFTKINLVDWPKVTCWRKFYICKIYKIVSLFIFQFSFTNSPFHLLFGNYDKNNQWTMV